MFRNKAGALGLAVALGLASAAAQADTFLFNPNGTGAGTAVSVDTLDWTPGNTIAINGSDLTVNQNVQDYFQAALGTALLGGTSGAIQYTNGSNSLFFTVVAGFQEQVTSTTLIDTNNDTIPDTGVATFGNTTTAQPSFFRICVSATGSNDLTGQGFGCTDANAILTGTLSNIVLASQTTQFSAANITCLDNFSPTNPACGNDNWNGQQTATSGGSANIAVLVNFVNSGYFPDLFPGTTIVTALTNTSLIDPYSQTNPSYCFTSDGVHSTTSTGTTCDATGGVLQAYGTLGAVNGLPGQANGPYNFMFQADANTSITRTVPEPATLALVGLSLGFLGFISRRRKH